MSLKVHNFTVTRWADLTGGFGKRKRYNEIIRGLEEKRFLYLYYPVKITIKEDSFGIVEITADGRSKRKTFCYPAIKNGEYTFDEVIENDLLGNTPLTVFQICNNGVYFDNDSFISSGGDPAYRNIGDCYEFHNISLTLTHPVSNMLDYMRRVNQLIKELKFFFETHHIFRFHNVLEVVLNILGITANEIKMLNIPNILAVENGEVIMATTQLIGNITTIAPSYKTCKTDQVTMEIKPDQPVDLIINTEDTPVEELTDECNRLINDLQTEINFCNKKNKPAQTA